MSTHRHDQHAPATRTAVTDPVCGMTVDPEVAEHHAEYAGQVFHFCSAGCRAKFVADPQAWSGPREPAAADIGDDQVEYTCPMHPEIRQFGPGNCPICGMALEPVTVTADSGPNPELAYMTRRFWVGVALSIPILIVAMGPMLIPALGELIGHRARQFVELVLSIPVVWWAGWPFFARGWQSIRARSLNMFTLIAVGVGISWTFSAVAVLAPGIFPPAFRSEEGTVGVYFEVAAIITTLVLLGQVLELRAREQTSGAIKALLQLAPDTARLIRPDGSESDVPVAHLSVGDLVRVRPGEKVPVDGTITEGSTALDESLVTGESMPVTKASGDQVIGGTLNTTGSLVVVAEKLGADSMLSRIVGMVAEAQRSRAPIQSLVDRVSAWFVPAVIVVAVVSFVVWALVGPDPRLAYALVVAVSVLIIACPCALGLATPMSIMVGVGRGAQAGVLIKNAEALERLERVDTLVVDKTGTLTEGRPAVTEIVPAEATDADALLAAAAAVENYSEHPLARAVTEAAVERNLTLPRATDFDSHAGKGVSAGVEGRLTAVGSAGFLTGRGVDVEPLTAAADAVRQRGATAVFVEADGQLIGLLGIADRVKDSTRPALAAFREAGITVVMLTGDLWATARAVAAELGIDQVEAEVLPDQKNAVVDRLRGQGRVVAMAGDGVNDAPALAAADVGIAMGTGTDVAIESAGVTLLKGDLTGLVRARHLSRATMRNIRQNLVFAFVYNTAGIPLAAGVLYPVFGALLSPLIAAAAMALSSVSVISNALRLRTVQLG